MAGDGVRVPTGKGSAMKTASWIALPKDRLRLTPQVVAETTTPVPFISSPRLETIMDKTKYVCGRCFELCELSDDRAEEAAAFNAAFPEHMGVDGVGFFYCDECWESLTCTHVPENYRNTPDVQPPDEIVLTLANVANWPKMKRALEAGMIVADATGRLRHPHGAPVGILKLKWVTGRRPYYREATAEWFAPDSQRAKEFQWPE
jgi:hypothetical protein